MFSDLQSAAEKFLKASYKVDGSKVSWELPKDAAMGDATTTVAMQLGKALKKPPKEIAEALAKELSTLKSIEKVEVAGPGYVNVWLTTDALLRELNLSREAGSPKKQRKEEAPVIVEYSDPNIAKPLGIHHILATIIGQAVSNMYRYEGYNVLAWNYIGDWGTQFGNLAVAVEKWGDGRPAKDYSLDELLSLYVRFHTEAEKDPTLEDIGRETFLKLERGDRTLRTFWEEVVSVTKASLASLYERLHVRFDLEIGESFYQDTMEGVLREGIQKSVFVEGDRAALIVRFPDETLPVFMVRKADGATLYATRDLAMVRHRIDAYHPQKVLYVVDVAQSLYFQQLFAMVGMLGWDLPKLEHVVFGRMRFAEKAMSTRKGNILKLEEVLDEAVKRAEEVIEEHRDTIQTQDRKALAEMMGIGSVAYAILSQNRRMDIVFDWDKMLSFEGNSAPYLQYTHARARSVLRKGEFIQTDVDFSSLKISTFTTSERRLIRALLLFPSVLSDALSSHMPHKVANFLYELAQDFNAFYNADPILKAEEPSRTLRLALTAQTASLIKTGAELLTLSVPDYM